MINIKDFDSSLIKIDKKSYKNIGIYNIGYIIIKKIDDYKSINSVNSLYLTIGKADGYIEENNGNKYLVFTSTGGNKKVLAKFTKLWDRIKYLWNNKWSNKWNWNSEWRLKRWVWKRFHENQF